MRKNKSKLLVLVTLSLSLMGLFYSNRYHVNLCDASFLKENVEAITQNREPDQGIKIDVCYSKVTISSSQSGKVTNLCKDGTQMWINPENMNLLIGTVYPCDPYSNATPALLSKIGYCFTMAK
jgi:3-isopropylmalate dehydratase small subunit